MTTDDIILHIFRFVDDHLPDIPKHSQAKLYANDPVHRPPLRLSDSRPFDSQTIRPFQRPCGNPRVGNYENATGQVNALWERS